MNAYLALSIYVACVLLYAVEIYYETKSYKDRVDSGQTCFKHKVMHYAVCLMLLLLAVIVIIIPIRDKGWADVHSVLLTAIGTVLFCVTSLTHIAVYLKSVYSSALAKWRLRKYSFDQVDLNAVRGKALLHQHCKY